MSKASKYGRVTTAKAYADFTGHPKEFQDKLLFAAGIEPIHAPSKISGGRRQSSADMHMVIDMFLEAIDHEDVDTFILMTGDADFVRMVATLRRRFGRKVIISGVQSTSTSLDLMNAGDARDPITKADCDMTGELGRMTRPLVTRADLDAQAATAAAAKPQKGIGGIFGGIFRKKAPTATSGPPIMAAPRIPAAPPAPRRMRATELRGATSPRPVASPSSPNRGRTSTPAAPRGRRAPAGAETVSRGRGRVQELLPVGPDTTPDDFEAKLVREIYSMPPGRPGYSTIKTIEENLRSKAGQLGGTRKEVPTRLERLEAMGLFKRESRPRGTGQVEVGVLVMDHPLIPSLTQGAVRTEARPQRLPRQPRSTAPRRTEAEVEASTEAEVVPEQAETPEALPAPELVGEDAAPIPEPQPEPEPEPQPELEAAPEPAPAPSAAEVEIGSAESEVAPFRWVTTVGKPDVAVVPTPAKERAKARSEGAAAKPRKRAPRKTPTTRAPSRSKKAAPIDKSELENASATEPTIDLTTPV